MRAVPGRADSGAVALKFLWVALFGFGVSACAQTGVDGAVSGSVADVGGAVVVGARVSFRNGSTSLERQITTDSLGQFFAARISPGDYEVTVDAPEFAPVTMHVLVELG